MDKSKGSQILKLFVIAAFLIITPSLSTSLRRTYLYFVLNLLIIALGLESGLLSFIFNPIQENNPKGEKPATVQTQRCNYQKRTLPVKSLIVSNVEEKKFPTVQTQRCDYQDGVLPDRPLIARKATKTNEKEGDALDEFKPKAKVVKKCSSKKIVGSLRQKVKKCPSTQSLFSIGGSDGESEEFVEDDDQELFHKAEKFIGNFYKQLEMQREDSWKKLQDLYTIKPFKSHFN